MLYSRFPLKFIDFGFEGISIIYALKIAHSIVMGNFSLHTLKLSEKFLSIRKKLAYLTLSSENDVSDRYRMENAFMEKREQNLSTEDNQVATIILGGGRGTRLFPLTHHHPKPAVPFGGRYRLIDVPVSNSINSNIRKIFIITQFLSSSLHSHLAQTYRFDNFSHGFIETLTAEQRPSGNAWFQGTADAVRQNVHYLLDTPVDYFLILSGDQLYNMDFRKLINFAQEKDADLCIATLPVDNRSADRMGIMKINERYEIVDFYEKPKSEEMLAKYFTKDQLFKKMHISHLKKRNYLASMGIYLFKRSILLQLLNEDLREDFGKHLIPKQIQKGGCFSYIYEGYWEDIGTIDSFHRANLALTQPSPAFNCYDEENPIYCRLHNLPGPKLASGRIIQSILCDGTLFQGKRLKNSILGKRTVVKKGTTIENSYIMGNDGYIPPIRPHTRLEQNLCIGEDCQIYNAIIDENVRIGNRVRLVNERGIEHLDINGKIFIRDGVILVSRGACIPDQFTL